MHSERASGRAGELPGRWWERLRGSDGFGARWPGGAGWIAVALLVGWLRWGGWGWPALALTLMVLSAFTRPWRSAGPWGSRLSWVAAVLLFLAATSATVGELSLQRLTGGWDGWWEEREERVVRQLDGVLGELLLSADRGGGEVAAAFGIDPVAAARILPRARATHGLSALAVYDAAGELVLRDGVHHGVVPLAVRTGRTPYLYGDGPLFGYLYSISPIPRTGGVVVAAVLLRADLPSGVDGGAGEDVVGRFRALAGEEVRIISADRVVGDGVWDLRWGGEVLFSVEVVRPDRELRTGALRTRWGRGVLLLLGLGGGLLLRVGAVGVAPALVLAWAGATLPLGPLLGVEWLFSPADYLLPGPFPLTLGRLITLLLGGVLAAALPLGREGATGGLRTPPGTPALPRRAGRPGGAIALILLGYPAVLLLLRAGASPGFPGGSEAGWIAWQALLALALTALTRAALHWAGPAAPRESRLLEGVGALLLAGVLALFVSLLAARLVPLPAWIAALWALPFLLAMRAAAPLPAAPRGSGGRVLLLWLLAASLGTTAALPQAWGDRVRARMKIAEVRMERVGVRPDPLLEFLLPRLAEEAESLRSRGVGGVELLLRGWVASGLAAEGYPLKFTLWSSGGVPREELAIGVAEPRPALVDNLLARARAGGGVTVQRFALPDLHYLGVIPLGDGTTISVVVPPVRGLGTPEPLGPLFAPGGEAGEPLTLVPLGGGAAAEDEGGAGRLQWSAAGAGWWGETVIVYPEGRSLARYELPLPPVLVAWARGGLLFVLDLLLLGLLLAAVRSPLPLGARPPGARSLGRILASFQARVTGIFLIFFLVPALFFGNQAYRTLEGAAQRTAEALARRAVDDAASAFLDVQGEMELLSRRVRADLLLYDRGSLVAGSPRELVGVGLFEGWLPAAAQGLLGERGEVATTAIHRWGPGSHMVAYRRLPGGEILAAPAPLRAGNEALRSREVAHLLTFSILLGAVLSLAFALVAGRVLARPIQVLQVASERVGSGNLRVRLPEDRSDEFAAVFGAFNRMVREIRRARRDLVRTTRRTQAILEEAATGLVALDPSGTVALANPRAAALLGTALPEGAPLVRDGDRSGELGELAGWIDRTRAGFAEEAVTDLALSGRRIRVRARRIARGGAWGGVVLSLEDVTDELRAERILAWGEMAQQVAHEVKNPLTPIKLAVQHIRRAWEDGRPDYGDILARNVEAILREIDRLAGIARSFSRFALPGELDPADAPLRGVDIRRAVDELLALYANGDGDIRFLSALPDELPPVLARETEFKEVLVNLLENARGAIPGNGEVVMEADVRGDGVEFRVRDTGIGIPPALLPRIFEPHVSTRAAGSGLGLAIVRRLVESWGGAVWAQSREGVGTTVFVRLRLPEAGGEGSASGASPPGGGGVDGPG